MKKLNVSNKVKIIINVILILIMILSLVSLGLIEKYGLDEKEKQVNEAKVELNDDEMLSQESAVIQNVASQTQSYTKDITVDIGLTRGGKNLEEGGVVYEGEMIKYTFVVTNNTEKEVDDVKITSTIPDGVKYGELKYDFEEARQPYYYEYEFNPPVTTKTLEIDKIPAGESETVSYEVHVEDLEELEESKEIKTEINTYIGKKKARNI